MDESRFQQAMRFFVDDAKVLSYGLSKQDLHAQLRENFANQELLRIRDRGEEIQVFLGFFKEPSPSIAKLQELTVMTPEGVAVPLKFLGIWKQAEVLRKIEHQDLLRLFQIDVVYDADKTDSEAVSEEIEKQLAGVRENFPGYHISVKPSEEEQESKAWMMKLIVLCVGFIYLCLALSLGSLVHPVVVLFAIPFGFMGVVFAFYLHSQPIGMMAIIGILGLAGVVVNDSLVMTTTINRVRKTQTDSNMIASVVEGAGQRFRAVILTSLTTLGGVFPLAYGLAGRAGWIEPMVLAVGWGLLFATILNLFFLPCLLLFIDDVKRLGLWGLGKLRIKKASTYV